MTETQGLQWTDAFLLGYEPMDDTHREFVEIVDKLLTCPDAEMAGLTGLDTKHKAVADEKFRAVLDGSPLDSGSVQVTAHDLDCLKYTISSPKGGVVVFSEIYYPGWTVTIDGRSRHDMIWNSAMAASSHETSACRAPRGRGPRPAGMSWASCGCSRPH